ncbi:MAG: class I adenylate cyclase [Methylophagaceae bacterium]
MEQQQVLTHFQSLNRTRIERLSDLAPQHQRPFFDLLALIFHSTVSIVPDPFSDNPPSGIIDYQPTDNQLKSAKKLKSSFQFKRHALSHYPIVGLYLINNHGLFNYPKKPHFDLWLVHITELDGAQRYALQNKLTTVRTWAESLGININTKLLSDDELNPQSYSAYELEYFYLNGLVVAGSIPLWWLIPPNSDYNSASATLDQRALNKLAILDFGEIPEISKQTLYNDIVDLLDSNLEQGINHILPLIHQQYYLRQYPKLPWLSHDLKHALYQNEMDPLLLDCMTLMLKQLERTNIPFDTLTLVRQSFYIHAHERLSQKVSRPKFPWRRGFIANYSLAWSWNDDLFEQLDHRSNASFRQCNAEHLNTLPIFENVSTSLTQFAEQQQLSTNQQHHLINTKLQRSTDSAPDIIPSLPHGLRAKNNEQHLYLYRFEDNGEWKISDIILSSITQTALYQEASLLQVLAWAICNQVLTATSKIIVSDHSGNISVSKVKPIIQQLLQSHLATSESVTNDNLLKAPELDHIQLFINLEQQPMARFDKQGIKLASLQNNPLNYADRGHSLIVTIEGLICSSWGEWHYISHAGTTSPLEMLAALVHWWDPQHKSTTIKCWCHANTYGRSISTCLEELYKDVNAHYQNNPYSGNYLLAIADHYYQLQWQTGLCDHTILPNVSDILSALSRSRSSFSASKINAPLDPSGLISTLLTYQTNDQISLFLQNNDPSLSLYIIDEFGSLFHQQFTSLTESTLIANFQHFIASIKDRNKFKKVRFFRLGSQKPWRVTPLPLSNTAGKTIYLPVTISMDKPRKSATCTIKCGPKHFSGKANDPELFSQVAQLMLTLRRSKNDYPLYITELNFPQTIKVTTRDYILQKQRLESLLNG